MKRFHSYLAFVLLLTCCATGFSGVASTATAADRPNIVWLTSEDNGPHLGCYGDDYATTPNLDALAAKGLRYKRCWSNAPVCAPARTTILTGMYPPSIGGQHMRSGVALPPDGQGTYPWLLKRDGYYCTNNSKTDYNLFGRGADTKVIWDESGNKAHWQKRPNDDTPFFAIFNFTISHESKLRTRPHKQVHDPAGVRVPAYHPDVPEVRQDWAQYYDKLTEMDSQVGRRLRELEDAGLMDDTIIFYYGDHGSGMPRNKRWPYNTGLHVPLIVYVPEKFKDLAPADYMPGGVSDQLVAFVDLGPTVLSIAGIRPPEIMQGVAFAGPHAGTAKQTLFGFRGRMDERIDCVRSCTDGRFVYIRNFMPQRIYGQHIGYMFQTPTTRIWKQLFDNGKLNAAQSKFWQEKPAEELYDLESDPDEVVNLAKDPRFQKQRRDLESRLLNWMRDIRDTGPLTEPGMHQRKGGDTIYEMAQDPSRYPMEKILQAALRATDPDTRDVNTSIAQLSADDAAIRYWAAIGLRSSEDPNAREALVKAIDDASPPVAIVASESTIHGDAASSAKQSATKRLLQLSESQNDESNGYVAVMALNALDRVKGDLAQDVTAQVKGMTPRDSSVHARAREYVNRLIKDFDRD